MIIYAHPYNWKVSMEKKVIDSELYDQLITNHERQMEVWEERRKQLRDEVKLLGEQIRFARHYLKRNKAIYERGE